MENNTPSLTKRQQHSGENIRKTENSHGLSPGGKFEEMSLEEQTYGLLNHWKLK
jgi:hypothetical protein